VSLSVAVRATDRDGPLPGTLWAGLWSEGDPDSR